MHDPLAILALLVSGPLYFNFMPAPPPPSNISAQNSCLPADISTTPWVHDPSERIQTEVGSIAVEALLRDQSCGSIAVKTLLGHPVGINAVESMLLNLCRGIMEEASWRKSTGRGIMEGKSWRRNHGRGIVEEESWRRNHLRSIREAPGRVLGNIWKASGEHLRAI